jgi:hypothetical protein
MDDLLYPLFLCTMKEAQSILKSLADSWLKISYYYHFNIFPFKSKEVCSEVQVLASSVSAFTLSCTYGLPGIL